MQKAQIVAYLLVPAAQDGRVREGDDHCDLTRPAVLRRREGERIVEAVECLAHAVD
jgi:hypothetical protein